MLIDLHVRSHYTTGCELDPLQVIRRAKAQGLDGVCFCDRNSMDHAAELKELGQKEGLPVWIGCEVDSKRGRFLCYFPEPDKVPPVGNWVMGNDGTRPTPAELVEKVTQYNGVVVASHPYDRSYENPLGDGVIGIKGMAAVEVLEAGLPQHANDLASEAAEQLGLPGAGGSGVMQDLEVLGKAATLFLRPVQNEADLVAQIRSAEIWPVQIGVNPPREGRGDDRYSRGPRRGDGPNGGGRRHDSDRPRRGGRGGGRGGSRDGGRGGGYRGGQR